MWAVVAKELCASSETHCRPQRDQDCPKPNSTCSVMQNSPQVTFHVQLRFDMQNILHATFKRRLPQNFLKMINIQVMGQVVIRVRRDMKQKMDMLGQERNVAL